MVRVENGLGPEQEISSVENGHPLAPGIDQPENRRPMVPKEDRADKVCTGKSETGRIDNRCMPVRRNCMKAACLSMALLTAALFFGSLLNQFFKGEAFYKTPLLLIPAGLFYAALVLGIFREKPSWKKAGFYLCHAGLLAVAVGALLFWGLGKEVTFHIPISSEQAYGEVQTEEEGLVSFGFSICIPDFEPVYTGEAVSQYRAELRLIGGGRDETRPIQVNSPVKYGGWTFYLMDYDHDAQSYVTLHAKKDPGNRLFATGLWMILIGTYLMCFRIGLFKDRPGREAEQPVPGGRLGKQRKLQKHTGRSTKAQEKPGQSEGRKGGAYESA